MRSVIAVADRRRQRAGAVQDLAEFGGSASLASVRSVPGTPAIGQRKLYPEAAAGPRLRFHPHLSVHALNHFAHDGQADAGSFVIRLELLKHLEQARLGMR